MDAPGTVFSVDERDKNKADPTPYLMELMSPQFPLSPFCLLVENRPGHRSHACGSELKRPEWSP